MDFSFRNGNAVEDSEGFSLYPIVECAAGDQLANLAVIAAMGMFVFVCMGVA